MAIDASAVARVLGIETAYKDLRAGGVLYLPQRIAVFAQGASDASYSTDKFQALRADDVGAALGFGSPAHLIAEQLFPLNGDGVGTVPVTIYPLTDHASGVAAVGVVTPTGAQTKAAEYRVRVANRLSEAFVIPVGASISEVCGLIGDAIAAVLGMPVKVGYTYGTVTGTPDAGNTGNGTLTALSVTGTPRPGAWRLVCNTAVADGGTFTLTDPTGAVVSTAVSVTGGAVNFGGLQFTLTDGLTDFIVGDGFDITVPATDVQLTAQWKGVTGNDIYIEVEGEDLGTTFGVTQPTGGLANPTIDAALAQVGNVWETFGLNALGIDDATALNAIQAWGDGRWGATVRKPLVCFVGNTETTVADATAVSTLRRTDKVNAQLVSPGSKDLPFVVAARQLARIAKVAQNNPPTGYAGQRATGLSPGADGDQWDHAQRDAAMKAGSSTIEVKDGVVNISNVITFYRPTGEALPAYRHVRNIVKLQNIIYNLALIFEAPEWAGAPLIPDDQPTRNPNARKPKSAKAAVCAMHESLGEQALISDVDFAKANTTAAIDGSNPDRLNVSTTVKLSGNSDIVNVGLNFGFYFGQAA